MPAGYMLKFKNSDSRETCCPFALYDGHAVNLW